MADVLIRGLSKAAIDRIDTQAAALGLSRNEFLRRKLEETPASGDDATVSDDDWKRVADTFRDLADPEVMDDAWR